jgi:hypothetical protein
MSIVVAPNCLNQCSSKCYLVGVTMAKKRVTSIKVDQELWKEAKIFAAKNDITLTELLDKALRKELEVTKMNETTFRIDSTGRRRNVGGGAR